MRLKVKSYPVMLLLTMIVLISMIIGCGMPQNTAEKQAANKTEVFNPLNVPDGVSKSIFTYPGYYYINCRWQPQGYAKYCSGISSVAYCDGYDSSNNQDLYKWQITNIDGRYMFTNKLTGQILIDSNIRYTIPNNAYGDRAAGLYKDSSSGSYAQWILEDTSEGYYRIKNWGSGRYLNIENHYYNDRNYFFAFLNSNAPSYWWSSQWIIEWEYPLTPVY